MLKIVDCAIAVCAITTNNRATNNPEKTLNFFTVSNPPFLVLVQKKTPSSTQRGAQLDVVVFRIFAAQHCAAREICSAVVARSQHLVWTVGRAKRKPDRAQPRLKREKRRARAEEAGNSNRALRRANTNGRIDCAPILV